MKPFLAHRSETKEELFLRSVAYVNSYLKMNDVPPPAEYVTSSPGFRHRHKDYYGWYQFSSGLLYVNTKICKHPCTLRRGNNYAGWKHDYTIPGILAHEVGHHIQESYEYALPKSEMLSFRRILRKVLKTERRLSNYEPTPKEGFAEAFRVFLLNPDLLAQAWPKRHFMMTRVLGLKPAHGASWKTVFREAPRGVILSAEKLLSK